MTRVGLALGLTIAFGVTGCRRPPDDIRTQVDARLADVRALAARSAARCEEARSGSPAPSPAVGTVMEHDPRVLQIHVECMWPNEEVEGGGFDGSSFADLRSLPLGRASRATETWSLSDDPLNEESITTPSCRVEARDAFDLSVKRPMPVGGGFASVTVTLER